MGIYDREYYRDKSRGGAWFSGTAPVCRTIILVNVAVFILDKFGEPGRLEELLGLQAASLLRGLEVWRLLTYPFYHGPHQAFSLLGNMLFLWMVGREMEEFLGTRDFVWLYGSASVLSGLVWAFADRGGPSLYGSGAPVLAVVTLYTLYNPTRELIFFFFPVEMRWLLGIYLGFTAVQVLSAPAFGVAQGASQLTAAAYGFVFKAGDLRITRLSKRLGGGRRRFRVISSDEPTREVRTTTRPSPPPPPSTAFKPGAAWLDGPSDVPAPRPSPTFVSEEQLNARLDEILVKIAREGKNALTDEEKRILDEASQRARSRRSERI